MENTDQNTPPSELRDRDNWIVWREELREGDDDPTKVPYTAYGSRGKYARSTDPETWTDYETAVEYYEEHGDHFDGVGFVFDGEGVLVGVDLDDCRDAETGDVDPWAKDVIDRLDSFTEVSPSGEGFHIYSVGIKPGDSAKAPVDAEDTIHGEPEFEMYDQSRYFTFTGEHVEGTPPSVEQRNSTIGELYDEYLADDDPEPEQAPTGDKGDVDLEDDELIEKIKASEQGKKFKRLWRGDTSMHDRDHSRADLALCGILAFWTGGDRRRIDSLFRQSGLMRDKWDEDRGAQTYGDRTIDEALRGRTEFYEPSEDGHGDWTPPDSSDSEDGEESSDDSITNSHAGWDHTRAMYNEETNKMGRQAAADTLEKVTDWMYVLESETLWVYDDSTGYFNPWGDDYARRMLERQLGPWYSEQEANETIARIEARNQTHRKELNARTLDTPLLCVGNGVVDLETGELTDHSPEYKFTRGLQWDYDQDRADTEPVRKFLDSVTKREADRDTILDHLAHGLMPGHPYRAFVVMYGSGSNGKTRVGKLLRGFVSEENAASVELQAFTGDDSFATGGLPGAFVNVGDDISIGEIRDTSIIKTLTGDGTLRANEKHKKQYEFENEAAMFFSANEPPRIRERTAAISDRLYPIEMPYRFVDNPDEDDPIQQRKIPGIAESLINDDEAMRGLLVMAVEHAQQIIESNGQYSMPESAPERRELYESASDPIKRFALEHLEHGDDSDVILKVDAFTAYTEMCDQQGERAATEDTFKQVLGEMASLNVESTRSRAVTPGDNREYAWKYVSFAESAFEFMDDRLEERYGGEIQAESTEDSDDESALGARPLDTIAHDPTGYATVTVEVVTVEQPEHEDAPALKGVVKDSTTAIDVVSWDSSGALSEGDTVLIENASVTEYNGKTQLKIDGDVTKVTNIQQGAGFTDMGTPDDGDQGQLSGASTDGGSEITGATARVREYIRTECDTGDTLTVPVVSSQADLPPEDAEHGLKRLATTTSLIVSDGDEWEVL